MDKLAYGLTRMVVGFCSWLPFSILYVVSDVLAFIFSKVLRYRKKVVHGNIKRAFPEGNVNKIADGFYRHFLDILLEMIKGFSLCEEELSQRYSYQNAEVFEAYSRKGKSVVLLAGHLANWEWGALALCRAVPQECVGVYIPISNKKIDEFVRRKRAKFGLRLV